jgi:GNAT superfamily N-acetyltransferase
MNSTRRLISSLEIVHRVNEAALAYTLARIKVLERIPGNPVGIAWRTLDDATALMARNLPSPSFNSVVGMRKGQVDHVRHLVEWYRERGGGGRFEIAAGDHDPAVGRELARLGFFQSGFHAALVGEPDIRGSAPSEISIEQISSGREMEDFLDAYVMGWSIPDSARESFKANVLPWLDEPGWSLYVAKVDGRPVATAILFTHAGVGYFADAATDPAFRGRGIHAALLTRRLRDAGAAGVEFVCSGADFLSTSHRNMERAGMRLVFLRAIWTPLE